MFQCERRICKLLATLATFIGFILMLNETSTVDANRRIINSMNVTSSNTEKVKVLNFGYDQFSGTLNISFQALQPWDGMKVRFY